MNNAKIGSPLYILREKCSDDLFGVLEKLAEIGFDGIEFLGFFGHTPAAIKDKLDSCGLKAVGNHVPFDEFIKNTAKVIEDHSTLGCGYITISAPPEGSSPHRDWFPNGEGYARFKEGVAAVGEMMNAAQMKLLFHNHAEELKISAGNKAVLENILDDICPGSLYFEPDLGWIQIGGGDPSHYLKKYKDRCPVIHFKDYYPLKEGSYEFRPTGYGVMDNAALYELSLNCKPEWYIMDHDCSYARDEFDDLRLSLEYFRNLINIHI